MKILVTGANGFIGRALWKALHLAGYQVRPAMRIPTQYHAISNQTIVGDITETTLWHEALQNITVVIHLAARVHVMNDTAIDSLAEFRKANVDATLNLARQAANAGVKRFIFLSSIKVNGEATRPEHPFSTDDTPTPTDAYGISKQEAEEALRSLASSTGMEIVIIRSPLVYGPGVRANFLNLMKLVKTGLPLPLGAIHSRRSMVALDNLIDLLITCTYHPAASGKTFMVSDDNDVNITQLLRMLACAMGKRSILLSVPVRIITVTAALLGKSAMTNRIIDSLQVDITQTKSILDWKPVVTMQESLNKTVAHFLKSQ